MESRRITTSCPHSDHTLGFFEDDAGHFYMTFGRLVERRRNDLGFHAARHIGNLLGTFVDEQYHHIHLGVIGSNGISNIFKKHRFTGFGLSDDKSALPLSNRGEHIDNPTRYIVALPAIGKIEFFFGEERSKMIERNSVSYKFWRTPVDAVDFHKREILLALCSEDE